MRPSDVGPTTSRFAGPVRRSFLSALLLAVAAALLMPAASFAARRHRTSAASAPSAAESNEGTPTLTGPYVEALVMEPVTGTVIFEHDAHQPWPTASLAKMMLTLIVAEKLRDGSLKLTDTISTSRKAAKMGGSQVYLKEGETFSLDDMMKAVMVHSANDASVAVAEYIGGSTDAFVQMMNQRAAALGMRETHYYSVHGLPPDKGQQADVASAWDQAILARELVKYPQVLRWSSIDTAPFRGGAFELRNTNHLVRTFPGCDGLKTGFYYRAGFNVVATANRRGTRLIAVVLGSPRKGQNFDQAATLMGQGFLNYEMYPVAKKGAPAAQVVNVSGGEVASFKPLWAEDLSLFLERSAEKNAPKVHYDLPASVAAPVAAGQTVGKGELVVNGKTIASAPLIAPAAIPKSRSLFSRLLDAM